MKPPTSPTRGKKKKADSKKCDSFLCWASDSCVCHQAPGLPDVTGFQIECDHCTPPNPQRGKTMQDTNYAEIAVTHGKVSHRYGDECKKCEEVHAVDPYVQRILTKERERVIKKLDEYKCDFNWDFEAPRGGKAKHKSYIALDTVIEVLKGKDGNGTDL